VLIDLNVAKPTSLEADVAIIGAGAAGLTIARKLVEAGKSVILLESGGLDYEAETAALNDGINAGEPYYDLEDSRLRFFGGTTAIWGGRSAELDAIDFEARDWVAHSGWPFQAGELRAWYDAAWEVLGQQRLPGGRALDCPVEALGFNKLSVRHWYFDRKFDRFGFKANKELVNDPRMTAVIHATVREIIPDSSGRGIKSLDVRHLGGHRLTVRARSYVLAAGGLENPRLLLASDSVCASGLGNDHDLVGRFFMEHPHGRGGKVTGAPVLKLLQAFRHRSRAGYVFAPLLTPSPGLQREMGILNSSLTIGARPPVNGQNAAFKRAYLHARHKVSPTKGGRSLWQFHRRLKRNLKELMGPMKPWWAIERGRKELTLVLRAEQSPNPDSRVLLDHELDAVGMRRIRLDWRLQAIDTASVSALVDALQEELRRLRLGEVHKAEWLEDSARGWVTDPLVSTHPIGGYHHMGTTRMSEHPSSGVTDAWGRIHGLDNLYIAGSSLFPTGGWANPTLTILALALRTADRMLGEL
jgi:choline dehydrogenase-like flavoprotein